MNPIGKRLIALFLLFSLMTINCASLRTKGGKREKHGAQLVITKLDGQQIEGELITVKPTSYLFRLDPPSLLLLDTGGKDVSIYIADIRVIRIVKKSKARKSALYGFVIGGISGILLVPAAYLLMEENDVLMLGELIENIEEVTGSFTLAHALIGAAAGLLIGGITGALLGTDKTIQIEGMTESEIQETLDKLRKKARIRDYK